MSYGLDADTIRELELERARISFWHFCNLLYPSFFKKDRMYLKEFCRTLEQFVLDSDRPFCVINLPPRHGKSFVAQCLTAWILGLDPLNRIMTGSYNEDLSGTFSKTVRNLIQTEMNCTNLVLILNSQTIPNQVNLIYNS